MRQGLVWIGVVFLALHCVSCVAAPQVVSDVTTSNYALAYDLAADYQLQFSSPDLNRTLSQRRPHNPRLVFPSDEATFGDQVDSVENLKISLNHADLVPKAGLLLQFADDKGRFLDRAELDTRMVDETWALGLGLSSRTLTSDDGVGSYALGVSSELSGLWGTQDLPSVPNAVSPGEPPRGADDASAPAGNGAVEQHFGRTAELSNRAYLGFHDLSIGLGDEGTRTLLLSLGGFVPAWGGEIIATYRLLQNDADQATAADQAGFKEQAVGMIYREDFPGWIKGFSLSLSYFDYQVEDSDNLSVAEAEEVLPLEPGDAEKWRNSTRLSLGDDLDLPFWGVLRGYRVDLSYETEAILSREEIGLARREQVLGSQLKLKTDLGTFYGRVQQSGALRKLVFGMQKKGWAGSQFKFYVEDIIPLTDGLAETRVSGQLQVPLERSLFDLFTLDFWAVAEDNVFAPLRRRGYLVPQRGYHVPDLNGSRPGFIP